MFKTFLLDLLSFVIDSFVKTNMAQTRLVKTNFRLGYFLLQKHCTCKAGYQPAALLDGK